MPAPQGAIGEFLAENLALGMEDAVLACFPMLSVNHRKPCLQSNNIGRIVTWESKEVKKEQKITVQHAPLHPHKCKNGGGRTGGK